MLTKLPKKVKVGNLTFKVEEFKESASGDEGHIRGLLRFNEQTIYVRPDMSTDAQWETFFHEVVHVILDTSGHHNEYHDEKLVKALGQGIYQVLKDLDWIPPNG